MFTNWLTSPTSAAIAAPPNLMTTPPDVILQVGPSHGTRFMAHSVLLAMHSGYLRSAMRLDENGVPNPELPIFLPNVTPEQFAPLFTYMYTGYLDLNIENIFGVLLATHVLHMPRALDICRAFLSRAQSDGYLNSGFLAQLAETSCNKTQNSSGVKIIRPIASKPPIPNIGFIVPPMPQVSLPSTDTPFRSFSSQPCDQKPAADTLSNSANQRNNASPEAVHSSALSTASISATTSKRFYKSKQLLTAEKPKKIIDSDKATIARKECEGENKTIIDVASCDGPVRFQRVLNDAYGQLIPPEDAQPGPQRTHKSLSISFHQQMAKNIRQQHASESQNVVPKIQKPSSSEVFNCVYCKHTFKSQYCYQKHAKRHLNPLSLDIASSETEKIAEKILPNPKDMKREVRPLDMNVQYYPCKTCGSKFPSYYFVHKHRKLCHSNEEASQ